MTLSEPDTAAHAAAPSGALGSAAIDRALAPAKARPGLTQSRRPVASTTLLVLACALTGVSACARTTDSSPATTVAAPTAATGSSVASTRPASTATEVQGAAENAASAAPAPASADPSAAPAKSPPAATPAAPRPASNRADAIAAAGALPRVLVHKSASCGCCGQWVDHIRQAGFTVEVRNVDNVTPVKERLGVPYGKGSCHTAEVGGYFIEGHVPAEDIKRLLAQQPDARGLVLPGMPAGSPGMETPDGRVQPYTVEVVANDGSTSAYAHHGH